MSGVVELHVRVDGMPDQLVICFILGSPACYET